jgi:hypothetical protein
MQAAARHERLWWWAAVSTIAFAGLVLRVIAARGGMWTDEAWSMIYAAEARDPLGVFLRINHDNNHHLNSLWLQAIGIAAPPLLARAPAIAASSLSIVAAGVLAGQRSRAAGIVAALLFAFTPCLVVFGSEARGYAMMVLAALLMLLVVSNSVDRREMPGARWYAAALALFGMLSHMTMAAPVAVMAAWVYLEVRDSDGPQEAVTTTLRLMGPALAVTVGVLLFVLTAAALSPTGMRLGGYTPFSERGYTSALDDLALWTAGLSTPVPWLAPFLIGGVALFVAVRRPDWLGSRARLYALLIVAIPLGAAIIRPGNTEFARYYLTSTIGLLLLLSEWVGRGLADRPQVRAGAALLLATLIGVGCYRDTVALAVDRGNPAKSIADLEVLAPSGARLAFAQQRLEAVARVAAAEHHYSLRVADGCAPAGFLLAAQSRWAAAPASVQRCGVQMVAIDSSVTIPLTGDSWVLYRARNLQSFGAADSGPAPGVRNRRLSSERA